MTKYQFERAPWEYGVFFVEDIRAYLRVADAPDYQRPFDLTDRRYRAWAKQGFYRTETADGPKEWRGKRYTTFGALLTARMVAMLRSRGVRLPRIRKAHEFLRVATSHEYPFIAKPIWTNPASYPKYVHTRIAKDKSAAVLFRRHIFPKLAEIHQAHEMNLSFVGHPALAAKWEITPGVLIDPRIQGGWPCVKGRRVPTSVLWVQHQHGVPIHKVANLYRVRLDQAEAALAFHERAGTTFR